MFFEHFHLLIDVRKLNDLFAHVVSKVRMWSCINSTKILDETALKQHFIDDSIFFLWPNAD